jgi:hypothetical protein
MKANNKPHAPAAFFPEKEHSTAIEYEAEWLSKPFWTLKKNKTLARNTNTAARSSSL